MNAPPDAAASSGGTVALFSTSFLPYSQTFIYDELRAHERYEVDVFCKERLNEDRFPYARYVKPPQWAEKIYENIAYWPRFDRLIGRGDYALVHAHFGTGAVYALPYVLRHDLPFVITFWGNDVGMLLGKQRYQPRRWRYMLYAPKLMARADRMLCVSREMCELVAEMSGRPEAVHLYRHGIDLARFQPRAKNKEGHKVPEVVMVGRFTEKKGHRYAIRAFAKAIEAGRNARLTLVGSGALEGECRRLVHQQGIAEHVTFAGVLSHEETAECLATADVALVPSVVARDHDREGRPTVVMEASASAVPVIGTYHAGIPGTVDDGETGFLVPERDVEALAGRLIRLLDDPALRRRFGQAAREKMEHEFDLHDRVRALERHYDAVC